MMQAIRISASDLDAFRYFMANEDASLADLIASLRHETEPTEAMLAGTALHAALEHCAMGEHPELSANGYTFEFRCDGEIDVPEIRELKATRDYTVGDCTVTLVGKVDGLHGRRVDDHKFTSRYDAERFMGSYQWRVYLDVFDADEFRWNIFEGYEDRDAAKRYIIHTVHQLKMHRYPDMRADVVRELGKFIEFAKQHLPERFAVEAVSW